MIMMRRRGKRREECQDANVNGDGDMSVDFEIVPGNASWRLSRDSSHQSSSAQSANPGELHEEDTENF